MSNHRGYRYSKPSKRNGYTSKKHDWIRSLSGSRMIRTVVTLAQSLQKKGPQIA